VKKITIRLKDETYSYLKILSEKHEESLNAMIEKLIIHAKEKSDFSQSKTEQELKILKFEMQEIKRIATANLLLNRENLKESAKCGFLAEANAGDENIEHLKNYVNESDRNAIKILKGVDLL
jgi:hypothetical protein